MSRKPVRVELDIDDFFSLVGLLSAVEITHEMQDIRDIARTLSTKLKQSFQNPREGA